MSVNNLDFQIVKDLLLNRKFPDDLRKYIPEFQKDLKDNNISDPIFLCDKFEYFEYLLQLGFNPNVLLNDGPSSLSIAARNKDWDIVKLLLKHDADPNLGHEIHALTYACGYNNTEIAKLLIAHKAKPDPTGKKNSYSPLTYACQHNNIELVELLLQTGAYVNIVTRVSTSPLFYACYRNNTKMIKLLIDHGANAVNNCCRGMYTGENDNEEFHSFTPLNFLEKYNNQEMIELLSEQLKIK